MDTNERAWLQHRGVTFDHKGRMMVHLPSAVDDAYFDASSVDECEPSIAELMRREVNIDHGGSHGRRRRGISKTVPRKRAADLGEPPPPMRIGRPPIGAEVRVYVHTMISQRSRELLAEHGLTLADVLDDCARRLQDVA